jgi:hypothetical protein
MFIMNRLANNDISKVKALEPPLHVAAGEWSATLNDVGEPSGFKGVRYVQRQPHEGEILPTKLALQHLRIQGYGIEKLKTAFERYYVRTTLLELSKHLYSNSAQI